jgi:uncharacterized membrane protein
MHALTHVSLARADGFIETIRACNINTKQSLRVTFQLMSIGLMFTGHVAESQTSLKTFSVAHTSSAEIQ